MLAWPPRLVLGGRKRQQWRPSGIVPSFVLAVLPAVHYTMQYKVSKDAREVAGAEVALVEEENTMHA